MNLCLRVLPSIAACCFFLATLVVLLHGMSLNHIISVSMDASAESDRNLALSFDSATNVTNLHSPAQMIPTGTVIGSCSVLICGILVSLMNVWEYVGPVACGGGAAAAAAAAGRSADGVEGAAVTTFWHGTSKLIQTLANLFVTCGCGCLMLLSFVTMCSWGDFGGRNADQLLITDVSSDVVQTVASFYALLFVTPIVQLVSHYFVAASGQPLSPLRLQLSSPSRVTAADADTNNNAGKTKQGDKTSAPPVTLDDGEAVTDDFEFELDSQMTATTTTTVLDNNKNQRRHHQKKKVVKRIDRPDTAHREDTVEDENAEQSLLVAALQVFSGGLYAAEFWKIRTVVAVVVGLFSATCHIIAFATLARAVSADLFSTKFIPDPSTSAAAHPEIQPSVRRVTDGVAGQLLIFLLIGFLIGLVNALEWMLPVIDSFPKKRVQVFTNRFVSGCHSLALALVGVALITSLAGKSRGAFTDDALVITFWSFLGLSSLFHFATYALTPDFLMAALMAELKDHEADRKLEAALREMVSNSRRPDQQEEQQFDIRNHDAVLAKCMSEEHKLPFLDVGFIPREHVVPPPPQQEHKHHHCHASSRSQQGAQSAVQSASAPLRELQHLDPVRAKRWRDIAVLAKEWKRSAPFIFWQRFEKHLRQQVGPAPSSDKIGTTTKATANTEQHDRNIRNNHQPDHVGEHQEEDDESSPAPRVVAHEEDDAATKREDETATAASTSILLPTLLGDADGFRVLSSEPGVPTSAANHHHSSSTSSKAQQQPASNPHKINNNNNSHHVQFPNSSRLMSAVALLASNVDTSPLLFSLFSETCKNDFHRRNGLYKVALCHSGVWRHTAVDSIMPLKPPQQLSEVGADVQGATSSSDDDDDDDDETTGPCASCCLGSSSSPSSANDEYHSPSTTKQPQVQSPERRRRQRLNKKCHRRMLGASCARDATDIYCALVQKGVAKLCGSYAAASTEVGDALDEIHDLSGVPIERFMWVDGISDSSVFVEIEHALLGMVRSTSVGWMGQQDGAASPYYPVVVLTTRTSMTTTDISSGGDYSLEELTGRGGRLWSSTQQATTTTSRHRVQDNNDSRRRPNSNNNSVQQSSSAVGGRPCRAIATVTAFVDDDLARAEAERKRNRRSENKSADPASSSSADTAATADVFRFILLDDANLAYATNSSSPAAAAAGGMRQKENGDASFPASFDDDDDDEESELEALLRVIDTTVMPVEQVRALVKNANNCHHNHNNHDNSDSSTMSRNPLDDEDHDHHQQQQRPEDIFGTLVPLRKPLPIKSYGKFAANSKTVFKTKRRDILDMCQEAGEAHLMKSALAVSDDCTVASLADARNIARLFWVDWTDALSIFCGAGCAYVPVTGLRDCFSHVHVATDDGLARAKDNVDDMLLELRAGHGRRHHAHSTKRKSSARGERRAWTPTGATAAHEPDHFDDDNDHHRDDDDDADDPAKRLRGATFQGVTAQAPMFALSHAAGISPITDVRLPNRFSNGRASSEWILKLDVFERHATIFIGLHQKDARNKVASLLVHPHAHNHNHNHNHHSQESCLLPLCGCCYSPCMISVIRVEQNKRHPHNVFSSRVVKQSFNNTFSTERDVFLRLDLEGDEKEGVTYLIVPRLQLVHEHIYVTPPAAAQLSARHHLEEKSDVSAAAAAAASIKPKSAVSISTATTEQRKQQKKSDNTSANKITTKQLDPLALMLQRHEMMQKEQQLKRRRQMCQQQQQSHHAQQQGEFSNYMFAVKSEPAKQQAQQQRSSNRGSSNNKKDDIDDNTAEEAQLSRSVVVQTDRDGASHKIDLEPSVTAQSSTTTTTTVKKTYSVLTTSPSKQSTSRRDQVILSTMTHSTDFVLSIVLPRQHQLQLDGIMSDRVSERGNYNNNNNNNSPSAASSHRKEDQGHVGIVGSFVAPSALMSQEVTEQSQSSLEDLCRRLFDQGRVLPSVSTIKTLLDQSNSSHLSLSETAVETTLFSSAGDGAAQKMSSSASSSVDFAEYVYSKNSSSLKQNQHFFVEDLMKDVAQCSNVRLPIAQVDGEVIF